jgi:serine/threonine-protein kinase
METRWGKRFGRYEVVAELGPGAMGVVYKARDPKIDRFVAIKTICLVGHVLEEQQSYRERFFQEAQAAGRLIHPSIVTIFDLGEDDETHDPYIVMEYVAGVPLNGMLAEGTPLPLNTAMRLTQQIAEALDCAHAQGIVHRDIKPSNIMVTADGQAKIMDFGIAKLDSAHLTLHGNALGTPAYISPEQLTGDQVDGRADIFSLGVILYSMVTGYRPFQGNSAITVCFKVANREPLAPTLLDPKLPRALDAVIARAMAKNPVDRYQRGMELALDLRELLENRVPAIHSRPETLNGRQADSGKRPAVSEAELASAGSLLSRMFTSSRIIVLCACATTLGLLIFYRPPTPFCRATADWSAAASSKSTNPQPLSPDSIKSPQKVSSRATAPGSVLNLEVNHHFTDGKISVWVDSSLKYSHALRGETKKHLLLFHSANGNETGKLSIPAGQHRIKVHAQSGAYDQRKELSGTFAPGGQKTLLISFDGPHKSMRLALD